MFLSAALPPHRSSTTSRVGARIGAVAAGAGIVALGGFAAYFLRERSQEEAGHIVVEQEGAFSLRR